MRRKATKKAVVGAVVVAVVGAAGLAWAGPGGGFGPGRDGKDKFERAEEILQFDVNRDGKLDTQERQKMEAAFDARRQAWKAEKSARHQEKLERFDVNKDGQLDDAERAKLRQEKSAEVFGKLDTNKDGSLSLAEFQAGAPEMGKRHGRGRGPQR